MCSCLFPFLRVDNINAAVLDWKEKICILSEEAKIGAHRKPMIFLHPSDCGGVLVELEQAWWIIHKQLIALKKSYHSVLWHWVLHCFCHWEVRTKLWKGIFFLIMCVYIHIYTQNICWLLWIFSWFGENFTEYLWNIINKLFLFWNGVIGYSVSAVWKGVQVEHRGHLTAAWPHIWDKGFLRMLWRVFLEQTI